MPDAAQTTLLDALPNSSVVREQLANHLRQLRLLRQMLRLAERVEAELRTDRSAGDAMDVRKRNALSMGDSHVP